LKELISFKFISMATIGTIGFFYFLAHLMVYFTIGHFVILSPLGAQSVLVDPVFRGPLFFAISTVFFIVIVIFLIKNEYFRYKNEKKLEVYEISLSKLSKIWSQTTEQATVVLPKEENSLDLEKILKLKRSKAFYKKHIKPSLSFFPYEKLEIIRELFKILEKDGVEAPSVARFFSKDPEKTGSYVSPITSSGKTSYDVFFQITLYEHSMNVADEAVKYVIKKDEIAYETVLCDAIIVALAHDIGKLDKIKLYGTEYKKEILDNNPHNHISKLFFSEAWPGYETIEEAIFSHHSAPKSNALLTRMIIEADKEARKKELAKYMLDNKEQNSKKSDKEEDSKGSETSQNVDNEEEEIETQSDHKTEAEKSPPQGMKDQSSEEENNNIELQRPTPLPIKIDFSQNILRENHKDLEVEIQEIKPSYKIEATNTTLDTKLSNSALLIDYTDELEANILGELKSAINRYGNISIGGIKSFSNDTTIYYSIIFVNQVIEKYVHVENGLAKKDKKEQLKSITKYIAGVWTDKKYTDYLRKDVGVTETYLTIENKQYKFLSIPLKGEIFGMNAFELEHSKDKWMKKILFSRFST